LTVGDRRAIVGGRIVASTTITGGAEDSRIPWDAIERDWRDREYETLRRAVTALEGVPVDAIDELLFAEDDAAVDAAPGVLRDAFVAAARRDDGPLLLALYVHGRCLDKWEHTEDYDRIGDVLKALGNAAGGDRADTLSAGVYAQLLAIVVDQAQSVGDAMYVEDAMSSSCPVAAEVRARSVADKLESVLEREQTLGDALDGPRRVVRADAETAHRYFDVVAEVANAVSDFLEQEAPGETHRFDAVLSKLEADLAGDVYESELRAHRAAVSALRDSAERPWLRIDAAELTYVYPFTLDHGEYDDEQLVERARGDAVIDALAAIGLTPATAHELDVDDLWESTVDEQGYSGTAIELPEVSVEPTAGAEWTLTFDAQVRLSRLGNHYLRIRTSYEGAMAHDINQALRRGSHAMGDEKLRSGTRREPQSEPWRKFPEYAEDVTDAIARALGADRIVNPNAPFHVVLAARSISVLTTKGEALCTSGDQLVGVVGESLLFHPVRHLATALEEWIRYPRPVVRNVLDRQGYEGDLVVRTENTTVSFMPASPEWLFDEYQEMIEFVASVPPLLRRWEHDALRLAEDLDATLRGGQTSLDTLHDKQLETLELEQQIRGQLAFLRSPALCRTQAQRKFLDGLWAAAGLPALERELERRLTRLAEHQARISTTVSAVDERNRRKRQGRIEIVLGLLAALSLAGVLQWVDQAFDVQRDFWAWGEAAALLVGAVVVAAIIAFVRRLE
jgi:hypothetical protein